MTDKIKVLIVDDHPVFRQGLRDVLETDDQIEVVGDAADGEKAMELAHSVNPDVILMDINLPTLNGLQVTKRIKAQLPDLRVITITGYDDDEQVFHAIRAGASAYCPKDITPEALTRAIHAAHAGQYVVEGKTMDYDQLVEWLDQKLGQGGRDILDSGEGMLVPLSPREMEILELVTSGMSNKEIAYQLGISHQTVKNHMTAILRKLDVDDRTQAAVYALKHGWVRLSDA